MSLCVCLCVIVGVRVIVSGSVRVFLFYLKPEKWVVLSQKEVVESGREIIFLIDIVL